MDKDSLAWWKLELESSWKTGSREEDWLALTDIKIAGDISSL